MSGTILAGIGLAGAVGSILFGDDGPVVLGPVAFDGMEVPATISWGGRQQLVVHKMPGGARVIDALGPDDAAISWSGIFLGPQGDRDQRAYELDQLRRSGAPVPLSWGARLYTVVVAEFRCEDQAFRSTYHITCEVLRDESGNPADMPRSLLGAVVDGINQAMAIISPVMALIGLGEAVVDTLTASQATVQGLSGLAAGDDGSAAVEAAVTVAQAAAAGVRDEAETALAAIVAAPAGNFLGSDDAAIAAGNLTVAAAQSGAGSAAQVVDAQLARLMDNLTITAGATEAVAVFSSPTPPLQAIGGGIGMVATAAGGTLFGEAAVRLGDATQWFRIAQASGLNDPMLSGIVTLTVPDAIQAPSAGIPATGGVGIL